MVKKKRSRTWGLVTIGILVLGAAGYAAAGAVLGSSESTAVEGAEVKRGPLRISVVERGNLKAAESVTLKSEIEGRTQVLYLIDEGTFVQPGDVLCELDVTTLADERVEQEIRVRDREAEYVKAEQNFEIQKSQNLSDIAKAEREKEFAAIDLQKYLLGDMPQDLQKADEDILLREEELAQSAQDLEWSEKLAQKGFLEQSRLDQDRLAKTRAEVALNQARRAKVLLEEYEIPRSQREYEAEVEEKERELDRVKLQARALIADYEAELKTSEARLSLERENLAKIDQQVEKAVLKAPVAGMVVYAVEDNGRWGGGEPMQEGAEVRERQGIITIPSAEGYIVEASLHESVLEKVTTGMPCLVSVDALPGRTFAAEVKFKAVLPDQQSWFANPDLRVYRTDIRILDKDPDMRPGMSCSLEILVDELPDTTYVPVQAIFLDAGEPICFVSDNGVIEKRPVEVGQNNSKLVEIQSGLTEGEIVLLSHPSGFSLAPASESRVEDQGDWDRTRQMAQKTPDANAGGEDAELVEAAAATGEEDMEERARKFAEENPEAAERMKKWAEENPEEAKKMREQWQKGGGEGGGRPGGGGGRPGGGRPGGGNRPGGGSE